MVELSVIRDGVAIAGVLIALAYYIINIRHQRETRQAQLFMDLYNNHITEPNIKMLIEMINLWEWEDYDDYISKYGIQNNLEASTKMRLYFANMEGIGVLCKKGLIDPELVYGSQYGSIIMMWEKFLPIIEEIRKRRNAPHIYEDPEYLYNEMIRMRNKMGHSPIIPTPDTV